MIVSLTADSRSSARANLTLEGADLLVEGDQGLLNLVDEVVDIDPVSYTHLDVYKRQIFEMPSDSVLLMIRDIVSTATFG